MVTREYQGIAEAGGVKDVCRELSEALARSGREITVFLPCYGFIDPDSNGYEKLNLSFEVDMNYAHEERREQVTFWSKKENGVQLVLVESARFSEKLGVYTYTEAEEAANPNNKKGSGHYDYFAMNVLLQKSVLGFSLCREEYPDVFHCQDGHTAILPAMAREIEGFRHYLRKSGFLVSIHNAGIGYHQDVADLPFARATTGLPWKVIYSSLLNGSFDPFLIGSAYGQINTVSENYARELQETELDALTGWLGHALKNRGIHLHGITNGITPEDFDPTRPEELGLPAGFDPAKGQLDGKIECRRFLVNKISAGNLKGVTLHGSLDHRKGQPLLTVISRLTEQKGIDVLTQAIEGLMADEKDFQMIVLGSGTREIEEGLIQLANHPALHGRVAVLIGFDPDLANLIYASGDFFVIPSLYEPCGLTDFIAQLMGNLPIVRATGGLVKVKDGFNGFSYEEHSPVALAKAIKRALALYRNSPEELDQMRINAVHHIKANYTWDRVMEKYVNLYKKAMVVKAC